MDLGNAKMTETDRLNLKKMIKEQNVVDETARIQQLKHSTPIAEDILKIQKLAEARPDIRAADAAAFREMCMEACPFLYNHYTDIFNRICRGELDLRMFSKFLFVLKKIEDGECSAHEGSFMVGKLLKEIYIDSALQHAAGSAPAAAEEPSSEPKYVEPRPISWREFKNTRPDMP
jgi:hypothetical protein